MATGFVTRGSQAVIRGPRKRGCGFVVVAPPRRAGIADRVPISFVFAICWSLGKSTPRRFARKRSLPGLFSRSMQVPGPEARRYPANAPVASQVAMTKTPTTKPPLLRNLTASGCRMVLRPAKGEVRYGSGQWSGAGCQVPGARCQVPGLRCQWWLGDSSWIVACSSRGWWRSFPDT